MNWALAYYLYTITLSITTVTTILAWINIFPIIFFSIVVAGSFKDDGEELIPIWKKYTKYSAVVLIISTFFSATIPSESQLVKLFGIHISQKIYEGNTEAVNKIPSQLLDIISSIKTEEE